MTQQETPVPSILEQVATLAARHALSGVAGALVTAGALDKDASSQFVTIGLGALTWAASAGWSYWQKRVAAKRLVAAIVSPAATPVVVSDATKP